MRRLRLVHLAAVTTAFTLSVVATLSWAWTGGVDQLGLPFPADNSSQAGNPTVHVAPSNGWVDPAVPEPGVPVVPDQGLPGPPTASPPVTAAPLAGPGSLPKHRPQPARCRTGEKLVPTCGILWGVAPGAFTDQPGAVALAAFERKTERHQDIYHAYHRGERQLFPTREEIGIARERGRKRLLFLNWKPAGASWAEIAEGDKATDAFLDRLAVHIRKNFPEQFFFTVHHEAEDNVREKAGSGYTAEDYSKMYRHVVKRLRAHGVDNLVTVLVHMAYVPHTTQSWFERMYPGDDVVDWIGFDTYAYSDPGYGHGDLTELLNRKMTSKPSWPGFYDWAVTRHRSKPLMVAEWGVWSSTKNPGHKADFYREMARQIPHFTNIRAMVHFDTPHNQKGQDSRVDATRESLAAYRRLGRLPVFQVEVTNGLS
ncbi:glycosyl hydrolase [Actinoplanes sp. NPDC051470]|uniref:glycoside hydrolase family 26 protein n=1 Tax=Actinoplanes sp. NPDC051470 TaxID=3157224 RepID=UPI003423719D